ncbi:MAG: hypothetical protein Q4C84_15540 [Bacillota bacterium]|nr:hypothetical protein [Bacillota bacterium]
MKEVKENKEGLKIFSKSDLLEIFPFGRTKLQQLLNAGVLPVVIFRVNCKYANLRTFKTP